MIFLEYIQFKISVSFIIEIKSIRKIHSQLKILSLYLIKETKNIIGQKLNKIPKILFLDNWITLEKK